MFWGRLIAWRVWWRWRNKAYCLKDNTNIGFSRYCRHVFIYFFFPQTVKTNHSLRTCFIFCVSYNFKFAIGQKYIEVSLYTKWLKHLKTWPNNLSERLKYEKGIKIKYNGVMIYENCSNKLTEWIYIYVLSHPKVVSSIDLPK